MWNSLISLLFLLRTHYVWGIVLEAGASQGLVSFNISECATLMNWLFWIKEKKQVSKVIAHFPLKTGHEVIVVLINVPSSQEDLSSLPKMGNDVKQSCKKVTQLNFTFHLFP